MANEGSTKPKYSELEVRAARWKKAARSYRSDMLTALGNWNITSERAQSAEERVRYWQELTQLNESELARVRGLLQRQWISVEERLPERDTNVFVACYSMNGKWAQVSYLTTQDRWFLVEGGVRVKFWQPIPATPTFPQSSSLVPQGAESADIGKLDTAHKSGVEMGKVNRVEEYARGWTDAELYEFAQTQLHELGDEGLIVRPRGISEQRFERILSEVLKAGSAETGGEKAAPPNDEKLREIVWNAQTAELIRQGKAGHNVDCVDGYDLCDAVVNALANFPRPSQNQTASGGVEGAHEGTTADKSGSREPAKLTNAHFEQVLESKAHQATCKHENAQLVCLSCGLGIQQGNSALAESSLSSPPPTSDLSAPTSPKETGLSIEQAEGRTAKEIRNNELRQAAFALAEDCVRDYGRALPNDKHWKIAVDKTTEAIYRLARCECGHYFEPHGIDQCYGLMEHPGHCPCARFRPCACICHGDHPSSLTLADKCCTCKLLKTGGI